MEAEQTWQVSYGFLTQNKLTERVRIAMLCKLRQRGRGSWEGTFPNAIQNSSFVLSHLKFGSSPLGFLIRKKCSYSRSANWCLLHSRHCYSVCLCVWNARGETIRCRGTCQLSCSYICVRRSSSQIVYYDFFFFCPFDTVSQRVTC